MSSTEMPYAERWLEEKLGPVVREELQFARTLINCVQPDPCPGCGNCRLCDSKCTCPSQG